MDIKMNEQSVVTQFYHTIREEDRLQDKHGQIEFRTTMKYIHDFLKPGMRILEVGAGTGRYSIALAGEGYEVDAVELVDRNIEVFKSKMPPDAHIRLVQGNAMDLACYGDGIFDITLSLGPMYHLFDEESKKKALREALRVTKPGGMIMIAYCMNEATMIQYCFQKETIWEDKRKGLLSDDFHWTANENDAFALMRPDEIFALTQGEPVRRIKLIATDGATRYMDDVVDAMSDELFALYYQYHLSVCERQDLIGASNHTLDILRKI